MPLPWSERESQWQACRVGHQVDLGADAASREAKGMVLRLLGIPLFYLRLRLRPSGWPG